VGHSARRDFRAGLASGVHPRDQYGREIAPKDLSPEKYPPLQAQVPRALANFFWYYTNLLYINNGYDFFSPDPGVSHIIRYEIYNDAGERIAKGQFPDRHGSAAALLSPAHDAGGSIVRLETRRIRLGEPDCRPPAGGSRRLTRTHGKSDSSPSDPAQVLAGEKIDAEKTYEVLGVMDHRRGDLGSANEPGVRIPGGRP